MEIPNEVGRAERRSNGGGRSTRLPTPTKAEDAEHLVWREFSEQFTEYNVAARNSRLEYQVAKVAAIAIAAAVTVCAGLGVTPWVTASLGAVLVVLEGLQQMFQWQANWISYRRSAETMRQHGFAFAAGMPPYDGPNRLQELAALMQRVASEENGSWGSRMLGKVTGTPAQQTG